MIRKSGHLRALCERAQSELRAAGELAALRARQTLRADGRLSGASLVEDVERLVDVCQQTLDLVALKRSGTCVQALNQPLLPRKQVCRRCRLDR
jgi:hypothetical protein